MVRKKINFNSKWGNTENLANMIPSIGVGMAELIKNAYDADAEIVTVELNGAFHSNNDKCSLTISDDGHGMTEEELEHWFTVGDSKNKQIGERVSKKGRLRTGGKGIGRFACKKIAQTVTLVTKAKNHPTYSVEIDWDEHDDSANIEDVDFYYEENADAYSGFFPTEDKSGTYLILKKFRDEMTGNELQKLHRNIHTLINPFSEIDDFTIDLRVPKDKKRWESIGTRDLTKFAQYSFTANIDAMGNNVEWKFENSHPWSKNKLKKNGSWETKDLLSANQRCSIRSTKIWIYYLSRTSQLKRDYKMAKTGEISGDDLDKICGFKLYRGKHRIYPYGEVGGGKASESGDWLSLTSSRNSDNVKWFGHNQLIAAAEVDPTSNPDIKDMANRTGLQDNIHKQQLIELLRAIVTKMKTDLCNPIPSKLPEWLKSPDFYYDISTLAEVGEEVCLIPTCKTSMPTTWSINPNLPKGIELDKKTGEISGKTKQHIETTKFTVLGKNEIGKHKFNLYLQINKKPEKNNDDNSTDKVGAESELEPKKPEGVVILDDPTTEYKISIRDILHNAKSKLDNLNQATSKQDIERILNNVRDEINKMLDKL